MATSYHVTLPEIEALGCMREEVSLRNVEEPTGRSDSLGDTRVNCGHLYCKYLDKITFTDSTYIIFRCCRFFFTCISLPQCWKLRGSIIGVGISHIDTPPLAKMGCP